jgi:3',5'-nucleoside bisphosphate phosphatase
VIDLHTHSRYSDGSDSPAELAAKAAAVGITAIALTDHDTTASCEEMADACRHHGIEHVPGVEVSLRDRHFTRVDEHGETRSVNVHVLAYFVPTNPDAPLQREIASLRGDRLARNLELVGLLNRLGFTRLTLPYVTALANSEESIGRPHFARAMTELHPEIVGPPSPDATQRIFDEWLGQGGRAYLPKTERLIEQFVTAGASSGVVFSIAHPLMNYRATGLEEIAKKMPPILASLREQGIKGVEALYGSTEPPARALLAKLARDAGMIPTGGSDYHGTYKADVALGVGRLGDLRVPESVLTELKDARD